MGNVIEKRISTTDLERFYKKEVSIRGKKKVEELVKSKRNTEKDLPVPKTIFLCHSHLDKTIVEKITLLFNKLDVNIYVD